jgi:hypothetical protein
MTPSEFKSRFIELLPAVPADLDLQLDRFVTYPHQRVAALQLPDDHKAFLAESGFPADAAPFLNFDCGDHLLTVLDDFPDSFMIGSNNYGDPICVDLADSGTVVYYNHDNHMKRVFINSSLPLFAESLCAFSQLMRTKDADTFINHLKSLDPAATEPDTFWPTEAEGVTEN